MAATVKGSNNESILQPVEQGSVSREGLHQVSRQEVVPVARLVTDFRAIGSAHPVFTNLKLEKASYNLIHAGKFYRIDYLFEGVLGESLPAASYSISTAVREEPIETHPDFEDTLAGTPASVLNAAKFVDSEGRPTTDDEKGIFDRFGKGDLHGVSSYRERGVTFSETTFSFTRLAAPGNVGSIDTPPGAAPTLAGSANWMLVSVQEDKRGGIFQRTRVWEASGPNGWTPLIYSA
jgi:hypothetical protein